MGPKDAAITSQHPRKRDLLLVYQTKQEWCRHYQTIIVQLNSWVTTFNAAIITIVMTSYFQYLQPQRGISFSLLLPIAMSLIANITSDKIDREMRGCFWGMSQVEDLLNLYDLKARDGAPLLGPELRESANVPWPQVFVWWVVNAIVILVCSLLFAYFYAAGS